MNKWILITAAIIIVFTGVFGTLAANNNKKIVPNSVHLTPFPTSAISVTQSNNSSLSSMTATTSSTASSSALPTSKE